MNQPVNSSKSLAGGPAGAFTVNFFKQSFAQANTIRHNLNQFIIIDKFNRLFQGKDNRRSQDDTLEEIGRNRGRFLHSKSAANLLKQLGQRYVQYINRKYKRSGTLWEGRFRSSIIDQQAYLFICQRYIEMNPVRAGMVAHPGEYPWSSYQVNGKGANSALLTPHPLYLELGREAACVQGIVSK